MKAYVEHSWIKDSDFQALNPISAILTDITIQGKERIMQFQLADKLDQYRQVSIYGENWNTLIRLFGDDTDNWKGKKFRLYQFTSPQDGKKYKQVQA